MRIRLPANGWQPRPYQNNLWSALLSGSKRNVAVWHRRAGKDEVLLHWSALVAQIRPATYWHMLPEAAQARKAVWDAVNPHTGKRRIDEAFPQEIRSATREQEMLIKFRFGGTWQVVGSDNYNSLLGSPPAGVTFSEWPLSKPDSWAYISPILEENGGWATFIFTPRGNNHGKATYAHACRSKNWFAELLTVDDTKVFSEEQLKEIKKEIIAQYGQSKGEAFFKQEYYCSWTPAFQGRIVYPEFDATRHVSYTELLPLVCNGLKDLGTSARIIRGWDNTGLSPACVVTYLNTIGQWMVVKEFTGGPDDAGGIVEFGDNVKLWCAQHFPENTRYIDYGDPAGKARDTIKKSAWQYLKEECGITILDGIQTYKIRRDSVAGRLRLSVGVGEPAILIDGMGCPVLVDGMAGGYAYPPTSILGMYGSEPIKNQYSHVCDALQYPATKLFGSMKQAEVEDTARIEQKRHAHMRRKSLDFI